ncbi:hypothetical protein BD413DRAFT_465010 [Trametes elegans]|nr:hypothetical protein BD413DRAFT_465010 [Trametes elegans]
MVQPSGDSSGRSLPPVDVALKWAVGQELIARLENEAKIYENHLGTLQGTVVPRYYGFFTGVVRNITVACMVLEFCQGLLVDDVCELNRRRMLAAIELHKAGVFHSRLLDTRHFIPMRDGSLRIVDFSEAKVHDCPGALPLCFHRTGDPRPAESCGELDVVESRFGVDAERHGRQLRWANGFYPEFVNSFFYRYS